MEDKLAEFARLALAELERDESWSSDTTDTIAEIAMQLGLAKLDDNGFFKRTEASS